MGDYVDFKALKREVSIEDVAGRYGVVLRRVNSSHDRGKCPLPSHPAGDDAKSFSINVTKQVWICHSTVCAKGRRGKRGGDVIELVAVMEACSLRDAGLKIASWFGIAAGERTEGSPERFASKPDSPASADSPKGDTDTRYGIYDPLAEWIELRAAKGDLSTFEKSAYLSVLGQIEILVREGKGGQG